MTLAGVTYVLVAEMTCSAPETCAARRLGHHVFVLDQPVGPPPTWDPAMRRLSLPAAPGVDWNAWEAHGDHLYLFGQGGRRCAPGPSAGLKVARVPPEITGRQSASAEVRQSGVELHQTMAAHLRGYLGPSSGRDRLRSATRARRPRSGERSRASLLVDDASNVLTAAAIAGAVENAVGDHEGGRAHA